MKLPSEVQDLCIKLLASVRHDPIHNVKIEDRFALYSSFGLSRINLPSSTKDDADFNSENYFQYMKSEFLNFNTNDYTLCWLAIISAKYVLPVFNRTQKQVNDKKEFVTVQRILQVAEKLLRRVVSFDVAYQEFDEFYWSNEVVSKSATYDVACVFSSAYTALEFILNGLVVREPPFIEGSEIRGGDIFIFKALEAYSSIDKNPSGKYKEDDFEAIAKDIVRLTVMEEPYYDYNTSNSLFLIEYDLKKRLEFWEWWLTEAIPQAWELAQQSTFS